MPLLEFRENSALTPPCCPATLLSGRHLKLSSSPFQGLLMTICNRLIYSKMFKNSDFLSVFIELFCYFNFLFTLYHFWLTSFLV